jgi:diadenylate cyclase
MGAVINWFRHIGDVDYVYLLSAAADIIVVAFIIYKLLMLVKGTRAWQIMWGLGVLFLLGFLSNLLHLRAMYWLLSTFLPLTPIALVILFFPELRHALEEVGRFKFLGRGFATLGSEDLSALIDHLTRVASELSKSNIGALVVIEREVGLDTIIASGHRMDAMVSSELLRTIFHPGSPLHDGAVVLRGNRIVAASCTLPLSDSPRLGTMIHTRHKAALGVSEESDAVVLVVSEETGMVSLSVDGNLFRGLSSDDLHDRLFELLVPEGSQISVPQFRRTVSSAFSRVRPGRSSEQEPKC